MREVLRAPIITCACQTGMYSCIDCTCVMGILKSKQQDPKSCAFEIDNTEILQAPCTEKCFDTYLKYKTIHKNTVDSFRSIIKIQKYTSTNNAQ